MVNSTNRRRKIKEKEDEKLMRKTFSIRDFCVVLLTGAEDSANRVYSSNPPANGFTRSSTNPKQ